MKPCPFCGSEADVGAFQTTVGYQETKATRYRPYCTNPRCGATIYCQAESVREAVAKWDERKS